MSAIVDSQVWSAPTGPLIVPDLADSSLRLSLVVPTWNERANIEDFLRALAATLDAAVPGDYEIIVLDDMSIDGTGQVVRALQDELPALRLVVRSGENGLAAAVIRGFQMAQGEILGTINADFQHPPAIVAEMLPLAGSADLVVASRFAAGGGLGDWAMHRRVNSRVAHRLGHLLLPRAFGRTTDPLSGCYLLRRRTIAGVELRPLGFKTLMEILVRGRVGAIAETGYEMRSRRSGRSKMRIRHWFDFFFHLLRLRWAQRR